MSWMDIAAAIAAQRHCSRPVVTASVDHLHFVSPVRKGWIVNLKACVNYVSKTSMEVGVRIDGENPMERKSPHIATAYLTFVGLDDKGKPTPVPQVICETDTEKRRYERAKERRRLRLESRKLMEAINSKHKK